jgi:phosphoribosylformylglycinamidine cyclo-ligase
MPDMYPAGEYDLAGFAVGVVEKSAIITGRSIGVGDRVLGIASSGPHSNGYSLIRRIVARAQADLSAPLPGERSGRPLGALLLEPTRIYVKPVLELIRSLPVKGLAHITGGGLTENVPRVLPPGLTAALGRDTWPRPPVFDWLQQAGGVSAAEMYRVFNCGIGMVVILDAAHAARAQLLLEALGLPTWDIGVIRAQAPGEPATVVE